MAGGRKLKLEEKQYIAEELLGSCRSPSEFVERFELDDFDGDLYVAMAAEEQGVWLCECCGWWFDEAEMSNHEGEMWCDSCTEEVEQ